MEQALRVTKTWSKPSNSKRRTHEEAQAQEDAETVGTGSARDDLHLPAVQGDTEQARTGEGSLLRECTDQENVIPQWIDRKAKI
jgi:hypothetical protein